MDLSSSSSFVVPSTQKLYQKVFAMYESFMGPEKARPITTSKILSFLNSKEDLRASSLKSYLESLKYFTTSEERAQIDFFLIGNYLKHKRFQQGELDEKRQSSSFGVETTFNYDDLLVFSKYLVSREEWEERAFFLVSSQSGLRKNNVTELKWSHLSVEIQFGFEGLKLTIPRSKNNPYREQQFVWIARHREVAACAVGALAFFLFTPNRQIDSTVFSLKESQINRIFDRLQETTKKKFRKKTHCCRLYASLTMQLSCVPDTDRLAQGLWSNRQNPISTSYSVIPKSAVLALAGFSSTTENYHIARSKTSVPENLINTLADRLPHPLKEAPVFRYLAKVYVQDLVEWNNCYPDLIEHFPISYSSLDIQLTDTSIEEEPTTRLEREKWNKKRRKKRKGVAVWNPNKKVYLDRSIDNAVDLAKEYLVGINGRISIRSLDSQFPNGAWRKTRREIQYYHIRKDPLKTC
ncbi:hypothetical protein Gasu2_33450 [Galdieria sulphuraria]|nr:hypothetical protein Gasu2_33450 [Galdieria sulphuraria]